jgi:hypothetical protein
MCWQSRERGSPQFGDPGRIVPSRTGELKSGPLLRNRNGPHVPPTVVGNWSQNRARQGLWSLTGITRLLLSRALSPSLFRAFSPTVCAVSNRCSVCPIILRSAWEAVCSLRAKKVPPANWYESKDGPSGTGDVDCAWCFTLLTRPLANH